VGGRHTVEFMKTIITFKTSVLVEDEVTMTQLVDVLFRCKGVGAPLEYTVTNETDDFLYFGPDPKINPETGKVECGAIHSDMEGMRCTEEDGHSGPHKHGKTGTSWLAGAMALLNEFGLPNEVDKVKAKQARMPTSPIDPHTRCSSKYAGNQCLFNVGHEGNHSGGMSSWNDFDAKTHPHGPHGGVE